MGLNNNLASALAPITKTVVEQKVKENALQNQAEALKLENDFITDMQSVTQTIKTDPKYATNKEAANIYLKEQSNTINKIPWDFKGIKKTLENKIGEIDG